MKTTTTITPLLLRSNRILASASLKEREIMASKNYNVHSYMLTMMIWHWCMALSIQPISHTFQMYMKCVFLFMAENKNEWKMCRQVCEIIICTKVNIICLSILVRGPASFLLYCLPLSFLFSHTNWYFSGTCIFWFRFSH